MSNDDCKKEISEFDLNEKENIKNKGIKKMYSQEISSMMHKNELFKENSMSSNKKDNNLSGININLNLNVNIRNHNKNPLIKRYNTSNNNLTSSLNFLNISDKKKFSSDDYNVISLIGEGSFGKIYQVSDENNNKYAMKKILANSIEEVNAIQSELEMLLSLSKYNLNLVNIHGLETKKLDKTTFVIYVLMDLAIRDWEKEIILRGKKKQYYKESELIIILKQLVHTFSELQRHKISHRDIKPQNILLFPDNSFRIADFGEAKEMMTNNRATIKQTIRGTELYMSPILFHALQKKNISKYTQHNTFKSDVFSLGLCLLFAATLTFNSLCEIREIDNTISIKIALNKYLKRYSNRFTDILYLMLEVDEKYRDDFIELENRVEFL
jgi:serine/threonine protein kinase